MKSFVHWTGVSSLLAGVGFQFPGFASLMMPTVHPGMLTHLFGLMAMFLGVMLVLCARDLTHRATLVMWEGVLRLGGFAVMGGYGLRYGGGAQAVLGGLFDLVIGVAYLMWLPRHLGRSSMGILLDR